MSDSTAWIDHHIQYILALKKPTATQALLLELHTLGERSPDQQRKYRALVKLEKSTWRAAQHKAQFLRLQNEEMREEAARARKARNHEMFEAAGLMSLAGLLYKETGKPVVDRGALLGALMELAKLPADDQQWARFKHAGDAKLVEAAERAQMPVNRQVGFDAGTADSR